MTTEYIKWGRIIKYSRSNVYLRDDYTCQLCTDKPSFSDLTLDHVVPRSHGGRTEWSNIVTCCKTCNEGKGNNKNIRPKRDPYKPSYYEMVAKKKRYPIRIPDRMWNNFLGWPKELVHIHGSQRA